MSLNRPLALSIGLAAGLVAAVGCYTAAAGAGGAAPQTPTGQRVPAAQVMAPQPSVSFAPCVPPAELEDGACVTHTVVTRMLPAESHAPASTGSGPTSSDRTVPRTPGASAATPAGDDQGSGSSGPDASGPDTRGSEDTATDSDHEDTNQQEDQDHEDVGEHADQPGGTGDGSGETHTG